MLSVRILFHRGMLSIDEDELEERGLEVGLNLNANGFEDVDELEHDDNEELDDGDEDGEDEDDETSSLKVESLPK